MENTIQMLLFTKAIKGKDGQEFDTYFMSYPDEKISITTRLTNDCKKQILKNDWEFPLKITLTDQKDYFVTVEEYENDEGITLYKDVVVLKSITDAEHLELTSKTLSQVLAERKANNQ